MNSNLNINLNQKNISSSLPASTSSCSNLSTNSSNNNNIISSSSSSSSTNNATLTNNLSLNLSSSNEKQDHRISYYPQTPLQQLPLKAYFLNKYEQLNNPAHTSASTPTTTTTTTTSISSSSASSSNPTTLSALLLNTNQQTKITPSSTISISNQSQLSPISSTLALFKQQQDLESGSHQTANSKQSKSSSLSLGKVQSKMNASSVAPTTSSSSKRHFSGSNSSLQNSDDDDDDYMLDNNGNDGLAHADLINKSREEKRRLSHTAAEQKRRNAIKRGYDELQNIVPSCEFMDPSSSQKVCKATVLKRCYELLQNVLPYCQQIDPIISSRITRATTLEQTIDYIHELEKEKDKHEHDLDSLKKEIIALKIMKSNYEEILQYHRNMPKDNSVEINDETKFDLFVKFSENLFQSFQSMINPNSFSELSASMFNWLEQTCSTSNLKNLVCLSLYQAAQQILH